MNKNKKNLGVGSNLNANFIDFKKDMDIILKLRSQNTEVLSQILEHQKKACSSDKEIVIKENYTYSLVVYTILSSFLILASIILTKLFL